MSRSAPTERASGSFIDSARIRVQGGRGGRGASSFRREPYVPRGGPDGGDGGRGGSVILVAEPELSTLAQFTGRRLWRAPDGGAGAGGRKHGRRGEDLELKVPVGTQVVDETEGLLGDLDLPGARLVVARGGSGGRGNIHFATPANRAPRLAEPGLPGEERHLGLELKLIADAALVGKPNAGKSSLLSALSAARPKVGDYPFTTLDPELGVVFTEAGRVVLADVPGLIEGASEGAGLGLRFLRHVERTRVLVYVVDGAGEDPWGDLAAIRAEVAAYSASMAARPSLVAVNKVDLEAARALRNSDPRGAIFVSALSGEGLPDLSAAIEALVAASPSPVREEVAPHVALKPTRRAEPPVVTKQPWGFLVRGPAVDRLLKRTDFSSHDGLDRFQARLRRLGIEAALNDLGVRPGDTVRLGDVEFEWQP